MTPAHIAERLGYPPADPDRRTHRVRTVGYGALTVHAINHILGLPRPVASGRGGRHRLAEPGDETQPVTMLPLTTGPVSIWAWAS